MSRAGGRDGAAPAGYDLLVCDLDGTLLDDSMRLDPALVEAFHRAGERGLAISLATGRMPAAADPYRDGLDITAPVISSAAPTEPSIEASYWDLAPPHERAA